MSESMQSEPGLRLTAIVVPDCDVRADLGESPLWDSKVGLHWLDTVGTRMFTLGLDGRVTAMTLTHRVTAIELGTGADLLAVTSTGIGWLLPQSGRVDHVLTVLSDPTLSMNDGAIDARGRCWAGSASSDVRDPHRRGELFCVDGDRVTTHLRAIGMSNGIDWSPDGDMLYHVDSAAGTLTAWVCDAKTRRLGSSRILQCIPPDSGIPDGLTVDDAGNIWLAVWGAGQVWRIDPHSGAITAIVDVPTPCTTSCSFGGPDMTTLYITTANYQNPPGGGLLYVAEVPARGQNPRRFTGALS